MSMKAEKCYNKLTVERKDKLSGYFSLIKMLFDVEINMLDEINTKFKLDYCCWLITGACYCNDLIIDKEGNIYKFYLSKSSYDRSLLKINDKLDEVLGFMVANFSLSEDCCYCNDEVLGKLVSKYSLKLIE